MKTYRNYLAEDVLIPFFGDKKIVGVEIGVLHGECSDALLKAMPNLKLYSVDPWLYQPGRGYESDDSQQDQDFKYKMTQFVLKEYGKRSIIVREKSVDAAKIITEPLDFVWIDGDHNEDTVREDILTWREKLKPRAILAGHDWVLQPPGGRQHIQIAVRELLGEPKVGDDNVWHFEYE
jgi:hypothetical protein